MPLRHLVDRRAGDRRRGELPSIRTHASLGSIEADWRALAAVSGNVFSTLEWASSWLASYGEGADLQVITCHRPDDSVAAIIPLVARLEGRVRVVRFLGHGPADALSPICAPADRPLAAAVLRQVLADGDWDLFIGDVMPADQSWERALPGTILEREANPVLSIDGRSWEEYLSDRSSNFRQNVRRRENRLARKGSLRFRLTTDPDRLEDDLQTLFDLHEARWSDGGSSAFQAKARQMHRLFAAAALERGWLRLWLLELDDRALAAWYGFRFGGSESFYQSGRDPEAERDGVGSVLFAHTIREAMNDRMDEYRLLRGDEAYKSRYADRDPGLLTIGSALSPRGWRSLLDRKARPVVGRALRSLRSRPQPQ